MTDSPGEGYATAQIAGILPFFVLMFASNAIVPVQTMPSWL